jgi:hypothetical protein
LRLGAASFMRIIDFGPSMNATDRFAEGFPIQGTGALALVPDKPGSFRQLPSEWSESEALALARRVHRSFTDRSPSKADFEDTPSGSSGSCVAHARRFAALAKERGRTAEVIYGLVAQDGRAFPHAWVRVRLRSGKPFELDPTSLDTVTPESHLAIGSTGAGNVYVLLLAGQAHVIGKGRESPSP